MVSKVFFKNPKKAFLFSYFSNRKTKDFNKKIESLKRYYKPENPIDFKKATSLADSSLSDFFSYIIDNRIDLTSGRDSILNYALGKEDFYLAEIIYRLTDLSVFSIYKYAIINNKSSVLDFGLKLAKDINKPFLFGNTLLHISLMLSKNPDFLDYLFSKHPNLNSKNSFFETPLLVLNNSSLEVLKLLRDYGVNPLSADAFNQDIFDKISFWDVKNKQELRSFVYFWQYDVINKLRVAQHLEDLYSVEEIKDIYHWAKIKQRPDLIDLLNLKLFTMY